MKARQQDRDNVSTLEKRVCEEQKLKNQLELMLKQEKKQQQKKLEEAVANLASTKAANAAANAKYIFLFYAFSSSVNFLVFRYFLFHF